MHVIVEILDFTDTLGHRDVSSLSAKDPRLRQWISIHTMTKDGGTPL